jgi:hypothetical protein
MLDETIDRFATDVDDDVLFDVIGDALEAAPDDLAVGLSPWDQWAIYALGVESVVHRILPNLPDERVASAVDGYFLMLALRDHEETGDPRVSDALIDAWIMFTIRTLTRTMGGFEARDLFALVNDDTVRGNGVTRERVQRRLARFAGAFRSVTDADVPDVVIDRWILIAIAQLTTESGDAPSRDEVIARVQAVLPPVPSARIAARFDAMP